MGVVCHEDLRVEALCAVICLFGSSCSPGYAHLYPVWAVGREVAIVVCVEVSVVSTLVFQYYANSAV